MITNYIVTIKFKDEANFTIFTDVTEYQYAANATMFYMKKQGVFFEADNKYSEDMVWYPVSNIEEIRVSGTRLLETKKEISEFKAALKGVPHATA